LRQFINNSINQKLVMEPNLTRRPFTFDRVMRIFFSICGIVAAIYILDILSGVLLPFLVACLVAYILEPIVEWNMRVLHTKRRFIPVVFTLIETTCMVALFLYLFIPYVVSETSDMAELLRKYATTKLEIPYISDNIHKFIRQNIDFNKIANYLTQDQWERIIRETLSSSWSFLSSGLGFVMGVISWLIVFLYIIFIMLDYQKLMEGFRQLVPNNHRSLVLGIFHDVKTAMNKYFRGQFIVAFIVGILFSIGFLIIKLPMAVAFGLFIGMLNMVPYLQLISFPIALFLCVVASVTTGIPFWTIIWECVAVYVIVQALQDLVITPRVMGKVMGLNPAIILLSLSVWGTLLGFLGLIIALPLTTLLLSYYDRYVVNRVPLKKPNTVDNPQE
jgi:predicted PurR-regulated permease PerM